MNINPYNPPSNRHCSNCRQTRPADGGKYILTKGVLKQRWICERCAINRGERLSAKVYGGVL